MASTIASTTSASIRLIVAGKWSGDWNTTPAARPAREATQYRPGTRWTLRAWSSVRMTLCRHGSVTRNAPARSMTRTGSSVNVTSRLMASSLYGERRPARNDTRSPREGIRDVEGVRELQDDAGEEAVLVVLVQKRQLHAVVLVDHDDAPEGHGILRSGYPIAHD